jgi:hypothetical protein
MTDTGVLEQVLHVEAEAWRAASLVRDPALVPVSAADELYSAFDRIERAAGTAKLLLAKRVVASGEHTRRGYATPEEYLAKVNGSSLGAAKQQLETSTKLEHCPGTAEALLTGEVSPTQGSIIADAAAVNPGAERELINASKRRSHKELQQDALRAKAAADTDQAATDERIRKARRLSRSSNADGAATFFGQGPATDAALIEKELEALIDVGFKDRTPGPLEPRSAYMWDALALMARNSRTHRLGAYADPNAVTTAKAKQPAPKWLALLHLDVAALRRGDVADGERCLIPGVGPIAVETARRELGHAVLKLVLSDGVDVLSVTSLTRRPTQAMQYAQLWTNPECIVEGCTRTRIEFDHLFGTEFTTTRHTRFVEFEGKCHFHHRKHTLEGWELAVGSGKRPIVPPDHPQHPANRTSMAPTATTPPPCAPDPPPGKQQHVGTAPRAPADQPNFFGDAA